MAEAKTRTTSIIQRIRVPLGFLFGVVFLVIAQPTFRSLAPGLALGLAGLLIRVWAAGHLRKHRELTVSGPYRWTRNPLYLGSLVMGSGLCLASGIYWLVPAFALLFLAIYLPVMKKEEVELSQSSWDGYLEYRKLVPLFIPRFPSRMPPVKTWFSWKWFRHNREYNAVIGFIIVAVYLGIRLYWP